MSARKSKPNFVRRNITVPRALHEQMLTIPDANWSRIAARAFSNYLVRKSLTKGAGHASD